MYEMMARDYELRVIMSITRSLAFYCPCESVKSIRITLTMLSIQGYDADGQRLSLHVHNVHSHTKVPQLIERCSAEGLINCNYVSQESQSAPVDQVFHRHYQLSQNFAAEISSMSKGLHHEKGLSGKSFYNSALASYIHQISTSLIMLAANFHPVLT